MKIKAAATLSPAGPPSVTPVSQTEYKFKGQAPKLSAAVKISAISARLKDVKKISGLCDSVALTARRLWVENAASLELAQANYVNANEDYIQFFDARDLDHGLVEAKITRVNLIVARANKPHLFTFYLDSDNDQSYEIKRLGTSLQVSSPGAGQVTVFFTFLPTQLGAVQFSFSPVAGSDGHSKRFYLGRVEIDVVA